MRRWTRQLVISVALVLGITGTATGTPGDPSSASTSFRIVEGEIGGNGQFNSTSTGGNFTFNPSIDDGGSSLGETAVGNGASSSFQTNSGFNTTAQPSLTFIVNTSTVALGTLSTAAKSTGTATFSVKDYTSYGYVVQIVGSTPTYGGHSLTAMTSPATCPDAWGCSSVVGTEQFGVNTVLNTVAAVGADPVQIPSSVFSFGVAGDGATGTYGTTRPYTVSDKWRFVSGETVASGPKSSGETDFTMTFLANISGLTPGGGYSGNISLVATGTY